MLGSSSVGLITKGSGTMWDLSTSTVQLGNLGSPPGFVYLYFCFPHLWFNESSFKLPGLVYLYFHLYLCFFHMNPDSGPGIGLRRAPSTSGDIF